MDKRITPGQWEFDRETWTIRSKAWAKSDQMGDCRGVIVADFTEAHGKREHAYAEAEANARLMAAAPALLAALQGIIEANGEAFRDVWTGKDHDTRHECMFCGLARGHDEDCPILDGIAALEAAGHTRKGTKL